MFPARIPIISQPPSGAASRDASNNYSLYYDSTDAATLADFPSLGDTFSISMWINFATVPSSGNYDNLISFGYGSHPAPQYRLFALGRHEDDVDGEDVHRMHVWDSTATYYVTSFTIAASTWYHMVVVVKPTSGRLAFYINGDSQTLSAQPSADWNIDGTSTGMIGRYHLVGASYTNAYIDEVAVFDTNLTADDVEDIYNGGTPTDLADSASYDTDRTGNLVRYWRMEEGTGNTVANSAGTGTYNASLSNTTWSSTTP